MTCCESDSDCVTLAVSRNTPIYFIEDIVMEQRTRELNLDLPTIEGLLLQTLIDGVLPTKIELGSANLRKIFMEEQDDYEYSVQFNFCPISYKFDTTSEAIVTTSIPIVLFNLWRPHETLS